ncbi:MAG: hypothetical protein EZS28_049928, partial [Streblomastix strix]
KPLHLPIQDVFKIRIIGTESIRRIEHGILTP